MSKLALVVALETELPNPPEGIAIYYCGVGKVNAAHATMKAIREGATKIINFGTAGLVCNKSIEGLVEVTHIVQRDMIAEPQAPRGTTPFEKEMPSNELYPMVTDSNIILKSGSEQIIRVGTGDSFVMAPDEWFNTAMVDLVDMEAYAIAKICAMEQIEFDCIKWVSDFADEDAAVTWEQNQADGASAFLDYLKKRS